MKIKSNKNNINEESKASIKEYIQKQIEINIKYHKIFFGLSVIINIGLITFIIFYKRKISLIKKLSSSHNNIIGSKDKELSSVHSSIDHKIVNMALLFVGGNYKFSLIFQKGEEFNEIKNIVKDYKKELDKAQDISEPRVFFIYQGMLDSDLFQSFMEDVAYFEGVFIFFETQNEEKFGIYINDLIIPDDSNEYDGKSKNIFLYSFKTKKRYNFIGDEKKSISFHREKLICLGDDELVIYEQYWNRGGYINYPLKSFDLQGESNNILTEKNGNFTLYHIEVFSFIQ